MGNASVPGANPKRVGLLGALALAASVTSTGVQSQNVERSGEQIVRAQCVKCHETGKGGAPRIGDRAAWVERVKQGLDAVVLSAIRGHGAMPARGGMADLTDAEFRGAIIYMFRAGGGAKE